MLNQSQVLKEYLKNRQEIIESEKLQSEPDASDLFNEKTFYRAFIRDMLAAKKEVIIYSPFVSKFRTDFFKQTIEKLRHRNIEIFIFTRPIEEYDSMLQPQIRIALNRYEELGVCVFYLTGFIHEKVAVIDREILWEGSLNILSQRASREIMRRTSGENSAMQIIFYLGLNRKLAEGYKLKYERSYRNLINIPEQTFKPKMLIFLCGFSVSIMIWLLFILIGGIVTSLSGFEFISKMVWLFVHN